jgi:CxxC-x17-CxxC domain-containing protein
MSQQTRTEIKCSDCGKTATVPFKPTAGKPVYCRECLGKHRTKLTETKNRVETKGTRLVPQSGDNEKQAWSRRRKDWK